MIPKKITKYAVYLINVDATNPLSSFVSLRSTLTSLSSIMFILILSSLYFVYGIYTL